MLRTLRVAVERWVELAVYFKRLRHSAALAQEKYADLVTLFSARGTSHV
jgi:hypothetical protein